MYTNEYDKLIAPNYSPMMEIQNNQFNNPSRHSSNINVNTDTNKLPPLKTPPFNKYSSNNHQFNQIYNDCEYTYKLIQNRIKKIQKQKEFYEAERNGINPYLRYMYNYNSLRGMPLAQEQYQMAFLNRDYNFRNMSNPRSQLINPAAYPSQAIQPIYYPLEIPLNGEPIQLPNIEVGQPNSKKGLFGKVKMREIMEMIDGLDEEAEITPVEKLKPKPVVEEPDKKHIKGVLPFVVK